MRKRIIMVGEKESKFKEREKISKEKKEDIFGCVDSMVINYNEGSHRIKSDEIKSYEVMKKGDIIE